MSSVWWYALVAAVTACASDRASSDDLRVEEAAPQSASLADGGGGASPSFEVRREAVSPRRAGPGKEPELPRLTIDSRVAATPSRGRRLYAKTSAALTSALAQARPGDVILLTPGATYTGNFVLRRTEGSGSGWITVRTDSAKVPAEGTRVAATAGLARLVTPNVEPALATQAGAHHYRVTGVEVTAAPDVRRMNTLVALGTSGREQRTASSVPHHIVLDRSYIHGGPALDLRRCVALNSAWTAIVDSYLAECHSNEGDSQAIWGGNGPGPYSIVNNRLEGAGENVMFGGADSQSAQLVPSDITLRGNYVVKPAAWQKKWSAKNLFELKVGKRVLVERNLFEGSWLDAQIGFAMLIKSVNQDGQAPWSTTQDVTIRDNRIRRSAGGVSVSGSPERFPVTDSTARVLLENNVIEPLGDRALGGNGRLFMIGEGARDVVLRHNTGFGTNAAVMFTNSQQPGFVFVDNIANGGEYRWGLSSADGHGSGADALAFHAPGGRVEGNVFIEADTPPRIPGNSYAASMAAVGFLDSARGDYGLRPDSPFRRAASDGSAPGADVARVDSLTAGVSGTR